MIFSIDNTIHTAIVLHIVQPHQPGFTILDDSLTNWTVIHSLNDRLKDRLYKYINPNYIVRETEEERKREVSITCSANTELLDVQPNDSR